MGYSEGLGGRLAARFDFECGYWVFMSSPPPPPTTHHHPSTDHFVQYPRSADEIEPEKQGKQSSKLSCISAYRRLASPLYVAFGTFGQSWHVTEPELGATVPIPHTVHCLVPGMSEYMPLSHGRQMPSWWYWPGRHASVGIGVGFPSIYGVYSHAHLACLLSELAELAQRPQSVVI